MTIRFAICQCSIVTDSPSQPFSRYSAPTNVHDRDQPKAIISASAEGAKVTFGRSRKCPKPNLCLMSPNKICSLCGKIVVRIPTFIDQLIRKKHASYISIAFTTLLNELTKQKTKMASKVTVHSNCSETE